MRRIIARALLRTLTAAAPLLLPAAVMAASPPPPAAPAPAAPEHPSPALPSPVIIAAEDAFPPWSLADGRGAANAIVSAAFRRQGIDVTVQTVLYARCRRAVVAGDVAACLSMGASEDTRQTVLLPAVPLVQARAVLVVPADDRATTPLTGCDPAGWRQTPQIGVVNGYDYPPEWEAIARSGRAKIVTVQTDSAGLRMLGAGRLDAMALILDPLRTADVLMRQAGQTFRVQAPCPLGDITLYVGFNARQKNSAALIRAFEAGYQAIEADGTLTAIMTEWRSWIDRSIRQGENHQAERRKDP